MLRDTRDEALSGLAEEAEALDPDAVVDVRQETSEIAQGVAEILADGTAVSLE